MFTFLKHQNLDICLKMLELMLFIFSLEAPCLFIRVTSRWIAVENQLGLLVVLASLKDAAPFAEQTISDVTILDVSGI